MLNEILLAVIQATTEFIPVSSSGHLALFSNIFSKPDIFFFTALHIASLIAVLIFTRKEIFKLLSFDRKYKTYWIYLIIATIPAALIGLIFKGFIEKLFFSYFWLGVFFIFNACVLFSTKFVRTKIKKFGLDNKKSLIIGLSQCFALFPGVSRSGMTISSGLLSGVDKESAVKFSFLLFIPLSIGAFVLESGKFYLNQTLIVSFCICLLLSILFLHALIYIIKKEKFWMFSIYSIIIGIISLILWAI